MNSFESLNLGYINLFPDSSIPASAGSDEPQSEHEKMWVELAFAVGHDMGTPLRHLRSYLKLLKEELQTSSPSENTEFLYGRLEESLNSLKEHQMGLFSYFQAGGREINVKGIYLDDLLKACLAKAEEKQILNISASLERVQVYTDPEFVSEVILELIENAGKFTKEGENAHISIALYEEGGKVRIDVEDRGIGFSMDHKHNLFSLFKSLHSTVDQPSVGAGAGLAVAARLCERIGGLLLAQAEVDKGATFSLVLPKHMEKAG